MTRGRTARFLGILAGAVAVSGGAAYYRCVFPYGNRHLCIKTLGLALLLYSEDNDGVFPSGEATAEASLGLLFSPKYMPHASTLGGKTVPEGVAERVLEAGGRLGPESCAWHYVEGLTRTDSPDIAIVWDKLPGYGHHCNRVGDGGREALFLDGHAEWVPGGRWGQFVQEQANLLAARVRKTGAEQPAGAADPAGSGAAQP